MRARTPAATAFALLALLAGLRGFAQELPPPPEPDWVPSLEVGFEAFDWDSHSSVQNLVNSPAFSGKGSDALRQLVLKLGGGVAGPRLSFLPGRPRLFLGGGVGFVTDGADSAFKTGEPASPVNPEQDIESYLQRLNVGVRPRLPGDPDPSGRNCTNAAFPCPEPELDEIRGQGSQVRTSLDDLTWYANAGVSFEVPLFETSLLEIRPGIAYRGERGRISGQLTTVTGEGFDPDLIADPTLDPTNRFPCSGDPVPTGCPDLTIFRSDTGRARQVYHHLGPRLELAFVLSRQARPVRTTFYVEGSFLWLLGDRTERLADPNGIARYIVERDETSLRGGAGFRFSWVGGLGAD